MTTVFRVEGDHLTPVEPSFQHDLLFGKFHAVKSQQRRENTVKLLRGRWPRHRSELESFLRQQESTMKTTLQERANKALKRESDLERDNYRYRLKELQDRSRERELDKLAKELMQEQVEALQGRLFAGVGDDVEFRVQSLADQVALLKQNVEMTRNELDREQKRRLNDLLPRRFHLREVRVLPLALVYLIPAASEDLQP
jgi:hypothetical protein